MDDQQIVVVADKVGQLEISSATTDDSESQKSSRATKMPYIEASCAVGGQHHAFCSGSPLAEMHNENLTEKEKKKQMNAVRWYVTCGILKAV